MDALCMALVGGYAPLGLAIVALWKAYQKASERLNTAKDERLAREEEHQRAILGLRDILEKKRRNGHDERPPPVA